MRYGGFFNHSEVWADNSELYRACMADPDTGGLIGLSVEDAKKNLQLYQRFPPGLQHDRLVAHKVDVYSIRDHVMKDKGRSMVVPIGPLELVLSVDLGEEMLFQLGHEVEREEIVETDVSHELPDGTIIRGDRVKKVFPNQGVIDEVRKFLLLDFNVKPDMRGSYMFDIDKSATTLEAPLQYHITKYVTLDKELIQTDAEIVRTAFRRRREKARFGGHEYRGINRTPSLIYSK